MVLDRPARSRAELDAFPGVRNEGALPWLVERAEAVAPETLVAIIRAAAVAKEPVLHERAARMLCGLHTQDGTIRGGHCEPIIRKLGRKFGQWTGTDQQAEFRAKCYARMWSEILAGTPEKPFWEERFFLALWHVAFDIGRVMLQQAEVASGHLDISALSDEGAPSELQTAANQDISLSVGAIEDAIRRLPGNIRRAAWLRWVEGWPIEMADKSEVTIATTLGVSGRMVAKYLTAAHKTLLNDPKFKAVVIDAGYRAD